MHRLLRTLMLMLALWGCGAFAATTVDINSADATALEQVKGIGPARAAAIVKFRSENGPFKSVDELARVPGIGDKSLEKLRPQLSAGTGAAKK